MRGRNGPPSPSLPFSEVLFAFLITSGCAQDLYQLPGHELFAVNQLWVCSLNFPHQHLSSACCLINVNVINCNQPPNPSTTPYSPPIHHPSTRRPIYARSRAQRPGSCCRRVGRLRSAGSAPCGALRPTGSSSTAASRAWRASLTLAEASKVQR
jgi:hypothetical protein